MKEWSTYDITDHRRLDGLGNDTKDILLKLLEHVKAGIGLFEVGNHIHALYVNDAYFECLGCTKEEYKKRYDDVLSTVVSQDVDALYLHILETISNKQMLDYEFRSTRQNGEIGWFHVKGIPVEIKALERPVFLAILNDITVDKEKDEQLMMLQRANTELAIQEERYRMLEATAQGILFEYFPVKDKMIFSYNMPNNRKRKEVEHYQQYLKQFPMVHSDHIEVFTQTLIAACQQEMEGSIEYLSTVSGGGYRWHVTYYKSVRDNTGRIGSVLGRIRDIHDSKMEKERMSQRAERDGLTSVYHKDVAFDKMKEYVAQAPFSKFYFVVLDLDDFKNINDQFGHQYGDVVIKDFAGSLVECFGEDCVIGRFGGDEFILLTKNIALAEVRRRLARVQNKIKFCAGVVEWKYDDKIERVFEKADKAMYEAKTMGKNGLNIR
ncbi:MAG: sensor domain-containing diguanylate cyclase [Lachnospiraceae bacterium]|nr:sensor domain-containing diguanylate cyclase [Lachnospiraceae bacterium]